MVSTSIGMIGYVDWPAPQVTGDNPMLSYGFYWWAAMMLVAAALLFGVGYLLITVARSAPALT